MSFRPPDRPAIVRQRPEATLLLSAIVSLILLMGVADSDAQAADGSKIGDSQPLVLKGSVTVATDAWLYGVRQTNQSLVPQLTLLVDTRLPIFAGIWAAEIRPAPWTDKSLELDSFVGFREQVSEDLSVSAVFRQYSWLGNNNDYNYDWQQLGLQLYYKQRVSLRYARGRDWYVKNTNSDTASVSMLFPAPHRITADLTVGYVNLGEALDTDYFHYDAGVARSLKDITVRIAVAGAQNGADYLGQHSSRSRLYLSLGWHF